MRALAEFIMRGRMQATLVVAGCAALPLLYWLGAAAGCLVLLRRGLRDALGVLALGLLPALIWWLKFDDPRALLVLLGSASLALVLRASESWNRVLLVSIAMGVVFSVVLGAAFGPQIEMLAQALIKVMPSLLGEVYQKMSVDEQARFASLIAPILTGLIAALLQIVSVLSLIVGRYWQALLYNPGGFGREFRAIRIPLGPAMLLLAGMVVTPNFGVQMSMLVPLCSVPLVFAGLALIHGLVAQKRLARFWLVGLYVTLLLFMQLIYPLLVVLAIVDSLIDFRGRLAPKDADNANGEG
ncbi:YybS family protein [Pseudomonas fluorescens group sp. PF-1]